jgi:hypothetical protein
MSADEVTMLQLLADKAGVTASDIVRTLVRKEYAATFGDKPPKKPKK